MCRKYFFELSGVNPAICVLFCAVLLFLVFFKLLICEPACDPQPAPLCGERRLITSLLSIGSPICPTWALTCPEILALPAHLMHPDRKPSAPSALKYLLLKSHN